MNVIHFRRLSVAAATSALGVAVLAGCGTSSSSTTPSSPPSSGAGAHSSAPSASRVVITIKNFAFSGPASVQPGATVTVTNQDAETHSVTEDSGGAFDVTVEPGASKTFTAPSKPGSYPYTCMFHSSMHGILKVG